jgi:predicted RNase H-like HicB family nuclease
MKPELVFEVDQEDGVFVAICNDPEMATQGYSLSELTAMIRDLMECHFEAGDERLRCPVRLHFLQDPILLQPAV